MPRLHPHKLDGALWIDIDPGVKKDIRKAWKSDFWGPWWNLGMVPENKTDAWWASFVQKYYWDDDHEAAVSFAWTKHCPSSISSRISQRKTSGVKPDFISTNDWKLMLQTWGTAKCVSRSKTNSKNRKSNKHGVGMHIHNAGAKGFGQIGHEMTVATGGIRPPITEIVRKTHTKKDGTYGDKHDESLVNATVALAKQRAVGNLDDVSQTESTTTDPTPQQLTAAYLEVAEPNKGRIYGLGSFQDINVEPNVPACNSFARTIAVDARITNIEDNVEAMKRSV